MIMLGGENFKANKKDFSVIKTLQKLMFLLLLLLKFYIPILVVKSHVGLKQQCKMEQFLAVGVRKMTSQNLLLFG